MVGAAVGVGGGGGGGGRLGWWERGPHFWPLGFCLFNVSAINIITLSGGDVQGWG
jgi:hypothetical protein